MKRDFFQRNYKRIITYLLVLSVILALLIMSEKFRALLVIAIFTGLNAAIVSYKRFLPSLPIEIEVLTLGIVLCTVVFGWKAGLVLAIIGGILSFILSGNMSPFTFPMLGGYSLVVIISYLLQGYNIVFAGILASIFSNILVFIAYHYLFRYELVKNLSFSISNILVNIILFSNLAPLLVEFLK